jgi:Kef-type K+ transport system membrane component KefB
MTTPLVGKTFLTVLLACGALAPALASNLGSASRATGTGLGFSGLPGPAQLDFARSLGRIATQALALAPSLEGAAPAPELTVRDSRAPSAAAAVETNRFAADQVLAFLATSAGETESEFRARRAVLGSLWADQGFAAELTAALAEHPSPEVRQAAVALTRLTERYRPIVAAQKGRIAKDIPALARLEKMGSFEDLGAFFEGTSHRAPLEVTGGVAAAVVPDAQLSLFDEATMARIEGRSLARPEAGVRQGAPLERDVPALAGSALAAAAEGPQAAKAPMTMRGTVRKALGAMREHKHHLLGYAGMIGIAAPTLGSILMMGPSGSGATWTATAAAAASHALLNPLGLLLLQAVVIIGVGYLMGKLLGRIGQPPVIGQVVGGLMLGPSVLGALMPGMMTGLFPAASLAFLDPLSQFGLLFFMFIVGLELDTKLIKKQGGAAGLVSHSSILFPFILGSALALVLFTGFAPAGIPFHIFALFMGISMSITAFPVLASILRDKGLMRTPLGNLSLTSAAVDDATAWPLLAFVVAIAASGSGASVVPMLAMTGGYVAVMLGVVKPLLSKWVNKLTPEQSKNPATAAVPVMLVIVSALATEMIGIHALFGAFFAGAIIPRDSALRHNMEKWLGPFSQLILLPIFFALTGLRTQLGLITDPMNLLVTGLIIAVAVLGKLGGAAAAARFSGLPWRDSLSVGALMNTRGLMELIVLNIGYSMGILTPTLFAMLVVMAVVTTFMTSPLLHLINRGKPDNPFIQEPREARS